MLSGSLVNYNRETLNISTEIEPTLESPIFFVPKSYPKSCEIYDPPDRETLSFIFYRNRSNPDTLTRPKTRDENHPKMSPNMSCPIEASHIGLVLAVDTSMW